MANVYPIRPGEYRRPDTLPEAPAPIVPHWGNELVEEVQINWLVPNLFPSGTATLLTGASFLGKTFLMQHLMIACALGKPWLDMDVTRCKSFAIFSEDPHEIVLTARRNRVLESYGASPLDLDPDLTSWLCASQKRPDFDPLLFRCKRFQPGGASTDLWRWCLGHVSDLGCGLFIIDNATTCLEGTEPDQVKAFCRMLIAAATQMGIAIILLHHPPKNEEQVYSGTRNWISCLRNIVVLTTPKASRNDEGHDDGKRLLYLYQSNWTAERPRVHLRWESGILVPDEPPPEASHRWPLSRAERQDLDYKVLTAMRTVIERGSEVYADPMHRLSMASRSRGWSAWRHVSREQVDDSVDRLVKGGQAVRAGKLVKPA